jgi:hypothetical protein
MALLQADMSQSQQKRLLPTPARGQLQRRHFSNANAVWDIANGDVLFPTDQGVAKTR